MVDSNANFVNGLAAQASETASLGKTNKLGGVLKNSRSAAEIDKAANDFEAMFINQMLNVMFNTVPVDENFGGGFAEETYKSLLVDEYGKKFESAGGIGLADMIKHRIQGSHGDNGMIEATKAYGKFYHNNSGSDYGYI